MAKSAAKTSTDELIGEIRGPLTAPNAPHIVAQPLPHSLLHSKRILVVDCDQAMCDHADDKLRQIGARVQAAPTGKIALMMARSIHFDVVLLDTRLLDMTGYDCCVKLREIDHSLPVILMTGYGYDPDHNVAKARRIGLNYVVFKPFSDKWLDVLESVVKQELGAESLDWKIPPIPQTGSGQQTSLPGSDRDLTSPEPLAHHEDVDKTKVNENRDWASTLSMKEALRVLDEHKSEFSDEVFPAVSAIVLNASRNVTAEQEKATEGIPKGKGLTHLLELREIADSDTATLKTKVGRINSLLRSLSGIRFKSADDLQVSVASLQMIVRRGNFDLILSSKISKMESGTKISVSSEKPSQGYPNGRMVIFPVGTSSASVRRISFFPLQISH